MPNNHRTPPDYEAIESAMWQENATNVAARLAKRDENLLKKVQTYQQRFAYDQADIEMKIREDSMFAAHFATDPKRQGFHEAVAAQWLTDELQLSLEVLPKAGNNALYIDQGGSIIRLPSGRAKPSKSLDFRWEKDGYTFYAMHKYTKDSGGAQGNQFNEMERLLDNFLRATDRGTVLIAIVDGAFYTNDRMEKLRDKTRSRPPKSFAVHIEEVPEIMESQLYM